MEKVDIQLQVFDREGQLHDITVPTDIGMTLMEACKAYELGVEGTCGGMALCASCQVYVESEHELPKQSDAELDMLDQAFFVKPNSRLGCQIHLSNDMDGMVVRIAPKSDV